MTFPDTERYYVCWKMPPGELAKTHGFIVEARDIVGRSYTESIERIEKLKQKDENADVEYWIEDAHGNRVPEGGE